MSNAKALHDDAIIFDGLVIAKWNRELFEDMKLGGLTARKLHRISVGRV